MSEFDSETDRQMETERPRMEPGRGCGGSIVMRIGGDAGHKVNIFL